MGMTSIATSGEAEGGHGNSGPLARGAGAA
jgi:hypothetical protein